MTEQTKLDAITALDEDLLDDALDARAKGLAKRSRRTRFISLCAACLAIAVAVFGISTAVQPNYPDPLSAEEVARIRTENSYGTAETDPLACMGDIVDLAEENTEDLAAVVVATVTADWNDWDAISAILGDEKVHSLTSVNRLPVQVDSVLYRSKDFSNESELVLLTSLSTGDSYKVGQQYVFFLFCPTSPDLYGGAPHTYWGYLLISYHLTEDDFIIPIYDNFTVTTKYGGWNVDAFGAEMRKIFKKAPTLPTISES